MEVIATESFIEWYKALDDAYVMDVTAAIDHLELRGVTLGYPYSSKIEGTALNIRELRIQRHGRPIRVFYSFDPKRAAVLLIGGDKTGDDRFYDRMVPEAERVLEGYLNSMDED